MSIYVSSSCLKNCTDIKEVLNEYYKAGIRNVELGSVHKYFSDLSILKKHGFNYLIHNYFPPPKESFIFNLASKNTYILEKSIKLAKKAISLCRDINAPMYSFHAGFRLDPNKLGTKLLDTKLVPYSQAMSIFEESVKELLSYAEKFRVRLAIEPNVVEDYNLIHGKESVLLLTQKEEIRKFLKKIGDKKLGLLLDTGHTQISSASLDFDKDGFFDTLAPYAFAVHLHDNNYLRDKHLSLNKDSWALKKTRCFEGLPLILESQGLSIKEILSNISLIKKANLT